MKPQRMSCSEMIRLCEEAGEYVSMCTLDAHGRCMHIVRHVESYTHWEGWYVIDEWYRDVPCEWVQVWPIQVISTRWCRSDPKFFAENDPQEQPS